MKTGSNSIKVRLDKVAKGFILRHASLGFDLEVAKEYVALTPSAFKTTVMKVLEEEVDRIIGEIK